MKFSLLPRQVEPAKATLENLRSQRVCIDASETGIGKMYSASWVASQWGGPFAVICPKTIIPVWERVLEGFGAKPLFVLNYEILRYGETAWGGWPITLSGLPSLSRGIGFALSFADLGASGGLAGVWIPPLIGAIKAKLKEGLAKMYSKEFAWDLPPGTLLIWDEGQRCSGDKSQNAFMMKAAQPFHNLITSATLAENPIQMRALGFLLGMHDWKNWYKWSLRNGCWRGPFGGLQFKKKTAELYLKRLHNQIFPAKGVRVRIADLGDAFPECSRFVDAYDFDDGEIIAKAYAQMEQEVECLMIDAAATEVAIVAVEMKVRAITELAKAPGLAQMAKDHIAEGNHVVIFTNFRESLKAICKALKTKCAVYGSQNEKERQKAIDDFQADKEPVIVVNIQAGGVGLSLHDLHGNFPRVALVCPTFSAKDLGQVIGTGKGGGRINREGAKSKAIYKIVYAAGTPEERACEKVRLKLDCLSLINDGDLSMVADFLGLQNKRPPGLGANKQVTCANKKLKREVGPTQIRKTLSGAMANFKTDHVRVNCSPEKNPALDGSQLIRVEGGDSLTKTVSASRGLQSKVLAVAHKRGDSSRGVKSEPVERKASRECLDTGASSMSAGHTSGCAGQPTTTGRQQLQHAGRAHAPLSPSKLRSVAICVGFENDEDADKRFADRGSLGHEAIEMENPELCGEDSELIKAVEQCLKYKHHLIKAAGGPNVAIVLQETRLKYLDQWGHADLIVFNSQRTIADLVDWKFAFNLYDADSPQFWAYVVGLFEAYSSLEKVRVHVPHPFRGEIETETFERKDFERLYGRISAIVVKARAKKISDYRISRQCAYCGAASRCVLLARVNAEIALRYGGQEFALPKGTLHGSEIDSPEAFAALLKIRPAVEKAAGGWAKAALAMHLEGREIPGFQVCDRESKRVIMNVGAVYELVKERVSMEDFFEACKISVPELMETWAQSFDKGKGKAKELLEAKLIDADLIGRAGAGATFLKATRE